MANIQEFVLCCIDGSSVTEAVCDYSSWIAKTTGAPLKLLHTIEHRENPVVSDYTGAIGLGSSEELLNELAEIEQNHSRLLLKKGELMLSAVKERAEQFGVEKIVVRQRHGSLSESLIDLESQIDILVVGIRGNEHEESSDGIGTQLETVIRSLHKPILVVNREYSAPKKIMLAYDGSEGCKKALEMVASCLLFKNLPCHIVHVGDTSSHKGESLLAEAATTLEAAGNPVVTKQLNGKVEEVLAQYQRDNQIDLTIMGAFSHNRFRGFLLGSFTAKMLAATRRPLLLLR